jgi:phosphopantothenoylcysteine synthetase/decarboxylase
LGYFFSPFLPSPNAIKANPHYCGKCKASISSFCQKNRNTKMWSCSFCQTSNPLLVDIGIEQIEEYVESKVGENGMYFIIDLCLPENELASIKEIISATI